MNKSVYLSVAGVDPGWIVGKISGDIKRNLHSKGITCRSGTPREYQGEDICYHLGYAYAKPESQAEINSVFITHIDDTLKEKLVVSIKDKFDSFICMSSDDGNFLISLGLHPSKVFGPPLPVRNTYVKPISLGIFSSYYPDGRKNDEWLLNFAKIDPNAKLLNFMFVGPYWGEFLSKFSGLGCSFEWHSVDRKLPYEYQFQQEKLSHLDYYFYLGFDGGAMGSYDAYAYGNSLILVNESYHLDIPHVDYPINNEKDFNKVISKIAAQQKDKIDFFNDNSIDNYVENLLRIWLKGELISSPNNQTFSNHDLLKSKRAHYKNLTAQRVLGMVKRIIFKLLRFS